MNNKLAKDVLIVFAGNIVVLLSSILTGVVTPKLLGVVNYGYYKIFTLYLTYTALLHLGFVDGILMIHGGEDYSAINKVKFQRNTVFFIKFQSLVAVFLMLVGFFFFDGSHRFLIILISIEALVLNLTTYYQFVSQATMRFKELSIRKILQAIAKIIIITLFWFGIKNNTLPEFDYKIYIISIVIIDLLLLIWYMVSYKDITIVDYKQKFDWKEVIPYFRSGITLTIAYQVANLVFSLDRQFVSFLFDMKTYGTYSFAYSLLTIIMTVVNTLSIVLFPNMKRKEKNQLLHSYTNNVELISSFSFAILMGYYPLCYFIKWFLPEYVDSLVYFEILFPGIVISSCITVILFNYYKVLNKNDVYFKISLVVLFLATFLNGSAYIVFKSATAISWASIITLFIWYLLAQGYLVKKYDVKWLKNCIYIILVSLLYYISVQSQWKDVINMMIYSLLYFSITVVFYRETLKKTIFDTLKNKGSK